MLRKYWDLLAVILLAALGAVFALTRLNETGWFSIFGFLMVLILPGYVFSLSLFSSLEWIARLLVSLVSSVVLVILGGLLLNITPRGLDAVSWTLYLVVVTAVGTAFAWRARSAQPDGPALALPRLEPRLALIMGLSAVFLVLAVLIAQQSTQQTGQGFSMLWASVDASDSELALVVGVENQERADARYHVIVEMDGTVYQQWDDISLTNGERFETRVALERSPSAPVRVLLFHVEAPDEIIRQVVISPSAFISVGAP